MQIKPTPSNKLTPAWNQDVQSPQSHMLQLYICKTSSILRFKLQSQMHADDVQLIKAAGMYNTTYSKYEHLSLLIRTWPIIVSHGFHAYE